MIEYILVVTVTVIIVMGLAQRMYKPLGDFVEGIMGTYVACLLETGELPSLGAEAGNGECRPPIMMGEDAPDTPDRTNSPAAKKPSQSSKDDAETSDKVTEDPSTNPNASNAPRAGSARPIVRGQGASPGIDGGTGGGKKIEIALDGGGSGGFFGNGGSGGGGTNRNNTRYQAVTGEFADEMKKKQEREDAKTSRQRVDGENARAAKKMEVKPPPARDISSDQAQGLDISQIIKYILIAGIIIILLVLIGGQALQLSKSWEKGE